MSDIHICGLQKTPLLVDSPKIPKKIYIICGKKVQVFRVFRGWFFVYIYPQVSGSILGGTSQLAWETGFPFAGHV